MARWLKSHQPVAPATAAFRNTHRWAGRVHTGNRLNRKGVWGVALPHRLSLFRTPLPAEASDSLITTVKAKVRRRRRGTSGPNCLFSEVLAFSCFDIIPTARAVMTFEPPGCGYSATGSPTILGSLELSFPCPMFQETYHMVKPRTAGLPSYGCVVCGTCDHSRLNGGSKKIYGDAQIHRTVNLTLFGKSNFVDIIKNLEVGSSWI